MATDSVSGLSIWLSFSRSSNARKSATDLIKTGGGPQFQPHITLLTLFNAKPEDTESVISEVKKISKDLAPLSVKLNSIVTKKSYFQSVLIEVEKTQVLADLYDKTTQVFSKYISQKADFYPHLSLFYGTHNDSIVDQIRKKAQELKFENQDVQIESLDIYTTGGKVEDWVHLGSCRISDDMFFRSALLINGEWENPSSMEYLPVVNPATRETFHYFPAGNSKDVDKAVAAATAAFEKWGVTTGKSRAKYLREIATKIREKKDELARMEVLDNGKPINEVFNDVDDTANCFDFYAKEAEKLDDRQDQVIQLPDTSYSSKVRFEPIGVAGLIIPWNYPLLMAAWKLAPCLAAGCTGILKPSEMTPLTALELGAIFKQVLPAGVVNILTGLGPDVGQPLAVHPQIGKIAFTGSVATGSKIMSSSSDSLKKVTLELGGKSPLIMFDDADIDRAIEWIMVGIFFNQGQVCSATSRVLIQEGVYKQALARLVEEAKKIKIGSGLESDTKLGPIVSEVQYNKILDFIKKGQKEGATLACGGVPERSDLLRGYFIEPTIFTEVPDQATIWREEIFGPVLCVRPFKTEEEALAVANDTEFGLAASVLSKDKERCKRVANALRAGIVWINCSQPTFVEAPWGGMKKSGSGRELGPWGLENYLEVKQITSYEDENGYGFGWYIKK